MNQVERSVFHPDKHVLVARHRETGQHIHVTANELVDAAMADDPKPPPAPSPPAADVGPLLARLDGLDRRVQELSDRPHAIEDESDPLPRFLASSTSTVPKLPANAEQIRYEVALRARNGDTEALHLLEPEAFDRSMTITSLIGLILAERKVVERQVMESYARNGTS